MGPSEQALIQSDLCPYDTRKLDTNTRGEQAQREDHVKMHQEACHLEAKERGLRGNQAVDTLIWTPSL